MHCTDLLTAYTLAKAGFYAEAEELVLSMPTLLKTAEGIDLLARIKSESGNLKEAKRLWQELLIEYPNHVGAQAALLAIEKKKPFSWGSLSKILIACIVLGLSALSVVYLYQANQCPVTLSTSDGVSSTLLSQNAIPIMSSTARVVTFSLPSMPTGAAIRDILTHLKERPIAHILVQSNRFATSPGSRNVLAEIFAEMLQVTPSQIYIVAQSAVQGDAVKISVVLADTEASDEAYTIGAPILQPPQVTSLPRTDVTPLPLVAEPLAVEQNALPIALPPPIEE